MLLETPEGLYVPDGDFHIDPWGAVPRALITHAHGDHARAGSTSYLCSTACAPLLRQRFGPAAAIESLDYGKPLTLKDVRVSFHPAGHILGSAQIRIEGRTGVAVVAGDYKRAADPTCARIRSRALRHLCHRKHVCAADLSMGFDGFGDRARYWRGGTSIANAA